MFHVGCSGHSKFYVGVLVYKSHVMFHVGILGFQVPCFEHVHVGVTGVCLVCVCVCV